MATDNTNHYNTNLFAGGKYGTANVANLLWSVLVDWTNAGNLEALMNPNNEAARVKSVVIERGRYGTFVTGSGNQSKLARNNVGTCQVELENWDRRYDPFYASSPLYPNVVPGHDFAIRVKNGDSGSTYNLFRGIVENPEASGYIDNPTGRLSAVDGWQTLSDRKATTALLQNSTVDAEMAAVLSAIGWNANWGSSLDAGSEIIPYLWADNKDAYSVLHELAESDLGLIYIDGAGMLQFRSRHNLYATASAFTLDQSQLLREPVLSQPWEWVKNIIRVQCYPRKSGANTVVWTCSETPQLWPGQSMTFFVNFLGLSNISVPASNVVLNTRTMNTNSDGSGAAVTSSSTLTVRGASAILTVTNTDTKAGYITVLSLAGKPLDAVNVSAASVEDTASQAIYGQREFLLDLPYQQSTLVAADLATYSLSWMKTPQPLVTVQIENRPTIQFAYDLGTYLTYTSAFLGINGPFRICKIKHESLGSMQAIRTTWKLEAVPSWIAYWLLGVAGSSELGVTTKAGF